MPSRRLLAIGAIALAIAAAGLLWRSAPWFSIWTFALLAMAATFERGRWSPSGSARAWLALIAAVLFFNFHLYYLETRRARSERLDYVGVFVAADTQPVRVGVGLPDLDVHFDGALADLDHWQLALRPGEHGFAITSLLGVDWIERKNLNARGWRLMWGAELGENHPTVALIGPQSAHVTVRLRPDGERGSLVWDGRLLALSRATKVHDDRLEHSLRAGMRVSELPGGRNLEGLGASDLTLSLLDRTRSLGPFVLGWPRYRLGASGIGVWRLADGEADTLPLSLAERDTIRLGSNGKVWSFAVEPHVAGSMGTGVEIRFLQRPSPRGAPLPPQELCSTGIACGIVSTRPMPPPVARFDLGHAGLDTTNFDFVGRLAGAGDSTELVGPRGRYSLRYEQVLSFAAVPRLAGGPHAGVLLRLHRATASDLLSFALTLVALFGLAVGLALFLSDDPDFRARASATSRYSRGAWGLVFAVTLLLGLRLALGMRAAYAPPYYERTADSAIGMWVSVALLVAALARWPLWAPRLWRIVLWGRACARQRRRQAWAAVVAASPYITEPQSRRLERRGVLGLLSMLGSISVLSLQRHQVLRGAGLAVALGILAWLAIGLMASLRDGRVFDADPFDVLTLELPLSAARTSFWTMAALAGLLVWSTKMPFVAMLVAVVLGSAAAMLARRARRPGLPTGVVRRIGAAFASDPSFEFGAFAAILLVVAVGLVRTLVEGPMVLFALVFLLFLFTVRAGILHWEISGMPGVLTPPATNATSSGWKAKTGQAMSHLVIVLAPVILLLPAAAFDFGLGLVFFLPLFVTTILAAGITYLRWPTRVLIGVVLLSVGYGASAVLFPSVDKLRQARTFAERAAAFEHLGGGPADLARSIPLLSGPVARATVRSLAARHPDLLEQVLPAAAPSVARDEIIRSLEQGWGGRAYAAAGWTGVGLANTTAFGRGISAATSYAENTFSAFVLSEHGVLGGIAVLAVYGFLALVVVQWGLREHVEVIDERRELAVLAIAIGGTLWIVVPAWYVAASNLGLVPLTGQNMPFLGLNAWSDVMLTSAISSAMIVGLFELPRYSQVVEGE